MSLDVSDIGAQPDVLKRRGRPLPRDDHLAAAHEPIDGTISKILHPEKPHRIDRQLLVSDIEGLKMKPAGLQTKRVATDPLEPSYVWPDPIPDEEVLIPFKRELNLDTSDIPGTRAVSTQSKFKTRDSYNIDDIEGTRSKSCNQRFADFKTRNLLYINDINEKGKGRIRPREFQVDPSRPAYYVHGRVVSDDDPGMFSQSVSGSDRAFLSLRTDDIKGATTTVHRPANDADFRDVNRTYDIDGATAGSRVRGPGSQRDTDPVERNYTLLDGRKYDSDELYVGKSWRTVALTNPRVAQLASTISSKKVPDNPLSTFSQAGLYPGPGGSVYFPPSMQSNAAGQRPETHENRVARVYSGNIHGYKLMRFDEKDEEILRLRRELEKLKERRSQSASSTRLGVPGSALTTSTVAKSTISESETFLDHDDTGSKKGSLSTQIPEDNSKQDSREYSRRPSTSSVISRSSTRSSLSVGDFVDHNRSELLVKANQNRITSSELLESTSYLLNRSRSVSAAGVPRLPPRQRSPHRVDTLLKQRTDDYAGDLIEGCYDPERHQNSLTALLRGPGDSNSASNLRNDPPRSNSARRYGTRQPAETSLLSSLSATSISSVPDFKPRYGHLQTSRVDNGHDVDRFGGRASFRDTSTSLQNRMSYSMTASTSRLSAVPLSDPTPPPVDNNDQTVSLDNSSMDGLSKSQRELRLLSQGRRHEKVSRDPLLRAKARVATKFENQDPFVPPPARAKSATSLLRRQEDSKCFTRDSRDIVGVQPMESTVRARGTVSTIRVDGTLRAQHQLEDATFAGDQDPRSHKLYAKKESEARVLSQSVVLSKTLARKENLAAASVRQDVSDVMALPNF